MKFAIVCACLLAVVAYADVQVLRNDQEVNPDSFKYGFEFDNTIKATQEGVFKNDAWNVNGQFEYVSPEGEPIKLSYVADELGYHPDPSSPLLPTPPPIPEHIIRAIAYIQSHTPKE